MSKYGFDENEVRRTIVTKIDKDGFNNQEVYEGNAAAGFSDWTTAAMSVIGSGYIEVAIPEIFEDTDGDPASGIAYVGTQKFVPNEVRRKIPLYKGVAVIPLSDLPESVVVEGNATILEDEGLLLITGDFSIGDSDGR